jgi:hypothetical protein
MAAEPQLQRAESAFVAQRDGVRSQDLRRLKPQSVAVVGFHRSHRTAEQNAKRHAAGFRQRIPGGHVKSGDRDHRQSLITDEMQGFARDVVKLDRRDTPPLQQFAEILQGRDQIAHGLDGVGLEIAPSDDAFFGEEIDQDQRPFGNGGDPGDHRTPQLEHDRSRRDGLECE